MVQTGYQTDDFPKDPGAPLKKDTIGTIVGATWTTAGDNFDPNANVLSFDGTDDVISIPFSNNIISPEPGFTFSVWVNANSLGELAGRVIDTGTNGYTFLMTATGFAMQGVNSGSVISYPTGWVHLLGTLDENKLVTLYFNATQTGTPGTATYAGTGTSNALIGNRSALDRSFDGYIKDVRIWNRVLGTNEITEVYKGNNIYKNLIAWYRLDEGSGTEVQNYAGRTLYETGQAIALGFFDNDKPMTDEEYKQRFMSNLK